MNFLLRHSPILTYDVDLWIEDTPQNLDRCEHALTLLEGEWGSSQEDWGPVAAKAHGWLRGQAVYCLISPHGAIDIFRAVQGLPSWSDCYAKARHEKTSAGVAYPGLSDEDMLACQLALAPAERNQGRIEILRASLKGAKDV
jgi:hypothetical protein